MNAIDPPAPAAPRPRRRAVAKERRERRFQGIAVSDGVAIGPIFGATEQEAVIPRQKIQAAETGAEAARLDEAIALSRKQLTKLRMRLTILPEDAQAEIEPLMDAYLAMLGSSRLLRGVRRRIGETLLSAEAAVVAETEEIAETILEQQGGRAEDRARQRRHAEEVREIGRRLVRNLTRTPFRSFTTLPDGAVLVCESLRPSDAALLDPSKLAGVATEEGGLEGHTSVMLRALGVPAVLGAPGLAQAVRPDDTIVVDGSTGLVVLNPSRTRLAAARRAVTAFARERRRLGRLRHLPAETEDGVTVELQANLELPIELPLIAQSGAQGIGLFRTEFLFMNRETVPDEDTQTEAYRQIVEAMGEDPVTIRVLDWGGEKEIDSLSAEGLVPEVADINPALSVRGIRMLLRAPELLETQFAAILRAAADDGNVRVMLPMVTTPAEMRAAREVYQRVVRRLRRRGERLPEEIPPLGCMIETPGAALGADALAEEADFFAIGTNDLTAYTLAVDRSDADVAELYDPLHPAVLRLLQFSVGAAARKGIPISICGEIGGNPALVPLLMGLGLRSFSMTASAVPRVKQRVRGVEMRACEQLAGQVMGEADPEKIAALVTAFNAS